MQTLEVAIRFDNSNAFGMRRVIGMEPKNRIQHNIKIEKEYIDMINERGGVVSDVVNMALNQWMIGAGWL